MERMGTESGQWAIYNVCYIGENENRCFASNSRRVMLVGTKKFSVFFFAVAAAGDATLRSLSCSRHCQKQSFRNGKSVQPGTAQKYRITLPLRVCYCKPMEGGRRDEV